MNTHISFKEKNPTGEKSFCLKNLAELIEKEADIAVQLQKGSPKEGNKDGGLTIALSITGLALSAVATLFSVLTYWRSQQPNYSVSIECGNTTIKLDNLSSDEFQAVIKKLEEENRSSSSDLTVLLTEE
ncbi:MAG: hypothetical protein D3921_12435 [Candidatus Electrothrix sp. AW1]|nr:hypothetical protein [Candidatus Electrothrix sp. AX1]MCI5183297.1 hypothetical protein [Candidatus Electrothrix gigas]